MFAQAASARSAVRSRDLTTDQRRPSRSDVDTGWTARNKQFGRRCAADGGRSPLADAERSRTGCRRAISALLDAFRAARRLVLAYVATDDEVPTAALIDAAFAAGKRVYLPRIDGGDDDLRRASARGRRSGPARTASRSRSAIDSRTRDLAAVGRVRSPAGLGRIRVAGGAGRRPLRPRLCRSDPARDAWSASATASSSARRCRAIPWDLRLDWVVTERGAVRCWRGGDPAPRRERRTRRHNGISDDGAGRRRAGRRAGLAGGLPPAPTS